MVEHQSRYLFRRTGILVGSLIVAIAGTSLWGISGSSKQSVLEEKIEALEADRNKLSVENKRLHTELDETYTELEEVYTGYKRLLLTYKQMKKKYEGNEAERITLQQLLSDYEVQLEQLDDLLDAECEQRYALQTANLELRCTLYTLQLDVYENIENQAPIMERFNEMLNRAPLWFLRLLSLEDEKEEIQSTIRRILEGLVLERQRLIGKYDSEWLPTRNGPIYQEANAAAKSKYDAILQRADVMWSRYR